jgi:hypothetical protein
VDGDRESSPACCSALAFAVAVGLTVAARVNLQVSDNPVVMFTPSDVGLSRAVNGSHQALSFPGE